MKIGTTKEKILTAVLIAERITGRKESLPILSCILIDAGAELIFRATNLEAGIEVKTAADISEKGVIAVPATILSQTLRSIGADTVTLSSDDENLLIESRGTKTLIKSIPHEEFPALPNVGKGKGVAVERAGLLHALQAVLYAASPSMIRPDLGSVYLKIADNKITTVATDSFRLAERTISDAKSKEAAELLIPLKHAIELTHILEHIAEDLVTIFPDDTQIVVAGDGVRFASRVVDAQFPNYKEIIPKKFTTEVTLLKNDFADVLRKARVFAGNDMHLGLHVYPKKKIFSATARSNDVGEMSDSIDAAMTGEDLDINFHIGYLADCLPSVQSDSLTLGFSGAGKPLVIRGVSDTSFMYLVMPLNR